jgi:hypothetical protein
MITQEWAHAFAQEWIESWNANDLGRVLAHYTDDFEMTTPYIIKFMNEPSGTLRGKARVGEYWKVALARLPDLHFELVEVFSSANSIAIHYRGALEKRVVEILFFNEAGNVCKAAAHYNSI